MQRGAAPNPTNQDIYQRLPPQKEKGGIINHSRSISNLLAARPRNTHRSSDRNTRSQEDKRRDMEAWGRIKANRRGILTAMEPFHFDPPDFDPNSG